MRWPRSSSAACTRATMRPWPRWTSTGPTLASGPGFAACAAQAACVTTTSRCSGWASTRITVRLPDLVAYQAAVQHPTTAFSDPELRAASVTTGRLGLPRAVAGNFAVTYQLHSAARRWAVRCFHRDAADRAQRYAAISTTLRTLGSDAFVQIAYLPAGIRVGQAWYPVTKMPWLDGRTFNRAVEERLGRPAALHDLEQRFVQLVADLGRRGVAHGDLQHGNILVDPSGALRLVDYDGMYVPALRGLKASETGDPNYQHPGRHEQFDANLDRFSALVIVVALRALSALAETHDVAAHLAHACAEDYARIPSLDDFLRLGLSASQTESPVPMAPLHASILNRLYGSPPAPQVRRSPAPAQIGHRPRESSAHRPSVPLHLAILNRLYTPAAAAPVAHAPSPARRSMSTGPRSWKVRRA